MAFALGCLVYQLVLLRMPITDDEGAYRLAAQILAKGRLFLPSDPDKDFFDHVLVVNDGRTFTQYFLGWPALMLPALLVGLEGFANAFYFALAMPAIFLVLRQLAGSFWARLGSLLALSSPMLFFSAGTLLSHVSCMTALAWALYFSLRASARDAAWGWHAGACRHLLGGLLQSPADHPRHGFAAAAVLGLGVAPARRPLAGAAGDRTRRPCWRPGSFSE